MDTSYKDDKVSEKIIAAAIEVHRHLGPGLLESVYARCLALELDVTGLEYESQVELPVIYKGRNIHAGFRLDFLIEGYVVETKAVAKLLPIHEAQLITYLKLARHQTGLLVNFNVPVLAQGIRRITLFAPP
ncbi:MAG: GxxExxY protein [bacterium]|nr:GxxExxY protein [bacterium]